MFQKQHNNYCKYLNVSLSLICASMPKQRANCWHLTLILIDSLQSKTRTINLKHQNQNSNLGLRVKIINIIYKYD